MKLMISLSSGYYLCDSNNLFDKFDLSADKLHRGSNVDGIYFATTLEAAKKATDNKGLYLYECKINIPETKIFYYKKTKISPKFIESFKRAVKKHTHYKDDWIDSALVPDLLDENRIPTKYSASLKYDTYVGAGYSALSFPDMHGTSLVVFEPRHIKINDIIKLG